MEKQKMSAHEILNHGCMVNNLSELVDLKSQMPKTTTDEMVEEIINVLREHQLSIHQSEKVIEKVKEVIESLSQLLPL
jgi:hypothetical protein